MIIKTGETRLNLPDGLDYIQNELNARLQYKAWKKAATMHMVKNMETLVDCGLGWTW